MKLLVLSADLWRLRMKCLIPILFSLLASISVAQTTDTLADFIQSGQRDSALELVRIGADVNQTQGDGTTPLHWAVYKVDVALVETLLSREANPNAVNVFGATPLAEAVKIANIELVEMLLKAGADPDALNQDKQTALMLSARIGALDIAEQLVKYGADVNVVEEWRGQTALMWAAANNSAEIAKLLIKHGAEVNVRANVLDWGTQISSEPRNQYRPSAGMTALLYAARAGCLECIPALLKAGADINLPDPEGVTPLMVAIDNSNFDLASYLLKKGAYPHSWDWYGRTALYVAVDMNSYTGGFFESVVVKDEKNTALDIIEQLLQAGVNPDSQLNMLRPPRGANNGRFSDELLDSGATPLLRAANSHDVEASKLLLEYGALVDLPNATGITPFMAAAGFGGARGLMGGRYGPNGEADALALVELLLEAGADVNAKITDTTSYTARNGRVSSLQSREGQTALYGAAKQGWLAMMDYLLAHGAQKGVVDDQGKTLLDAAQVTGGRQGPPNETVIAYLKELL